MCVRALIHKFLFIPSDSDLSYTIEKEQVHTATHICYLKARGGGTSQRDQLIFILRPLERRETLSQTTIRFNWAFPLEAELFFYRVPGELEKSWKKLSQMLSRANKSPKRGHIFHFSRPSERLTCFSDPQRDSQRLKNISIGATHTSNLFRQSKKRLLKIIDFYRIFGGTKAIGFTSSLNSPNIYFLTRLKIYSTFTQSVFRPSFEEGY